MQTTIPNDVLLFSIAPYLQVQELSKVKCLCKYLYQNMPDALFKQFAPNHIANNLHLSWYQLAKNYRSKFLIIGTDQSYTKVVMEKFDEFALRATLLDMKQENYVPTLNQIQAYDAVFVFGDSCAFVLDEWAKQLGDTLAQYVQSGGGLVTCSFANCNNVTQGHLQGAMLQLMPVPISTQSTIAATKLVPTTHFIFDNVNDPFERPSSGDTAKGNSIPNGKVICRFNDFMNTVAAGELKHGNGIIISFNFFPYMNAKFEPKMFVNALLHVCRI